MTPSEFSEHKERDVVLVLHHRHVGVMNARSCAQNECAQHSSAVQDFRTGSPRPRRALSPVSCENPSRCLNKDRESMRIKNRRHNASHRDRARANARPCALQDEDRLIHAHSHGHGPLHALRVVLDLEADASRAAYAGGRHARTSYSHRPAACRRTGCDNRAIRLDELSRCAQGAQDPRSRANGQLLDGRS